MGDFMFDFNDGSMSLDGTNNGIPIPRSQHQLYLRSDFGGQNYIYDNDSLSPSRPPLVPPNSLVMNAGSISSQFSLPMENQRTAFSPFNCSGSPLMSANEDLLDMEIKMEPLEELIDISRIHQQEWNPREDNLLDNVNFEDLLMTDEMDSSTTCLDPQHSSPAAMATVHPDEVLGLIRNEAYPHDAFTPSISVPVKTENVSFGGLATSFPPQGIGWKDPVPPSDQPPHYQAMNPSPQMHPRSFSKENNSVSNSYNLSRVLFVNEFSPQTAASLQRGEEPHPATSPSPYNNNEPLYTQLESTSTPTNSALHDLLVNSPTTSHSPQPTPHHPYHLNQHHSQQLSPPSSNVSPSSPQRGIIQEDIPVGQSVPGAPSFLMTRSPHLSSRLSSSAPVNDFCLDQIWQRREPRQHLISTGSLVEEVGGGSTSSLSTGGGVLSPTPHDISIDDGIDSDEDSDADHYDSDSDNDSIMSEEMSSVGGSQAGKKERHFWQYNVQAKGPKGHRVNITHNETNPHRLDKIMDPVFSHLCSIQGIKHSGKARRGDGNDLTPSPRKLVSIGVELSKLNRKINEMTPVSELPSTVRSKSRKEKNKLASRACRLKKKAQHEANKIKLYGLEQEHKGMMALIARTKKELLEKVDLMTRVSSPGVDRVSSEGQDRVTTGSPLSNEPGGGVIGGFSPPVGSWHPGEGGGGGASDALTHMQQILSSHIEKAAKMRTKQRIAGFTTEFVNKVIETCRHGNPTGGLDELAQTFVKTAVSPANEGCLNYNNELYT